MRLLLTTLLLAALAAPGDSAQESFPASEFAQQMEAADMPLDGEAAIRRFVANAEHDAFVERVIDAESAARAEQLGVWAESADPER